MNSAPSSVRCCDSCGKQAIHTCAKCNTFNWCSAKECIAAASTLHEFGCFDATSTDISVLMKHLEIARQDLLALPMDHIGSANALDDSDAIEALQESMLDGDQQHLVREWIVESKTGIHSGLRDEVDDIDLALHLARESVEMYSKEVEAYMPLIEEQDERVFHEHVDRMADLYDTLQATLPSGPMTKLTPLQKEQLFHLIALPRKMGQLKRRAKKVITKAKAKLGGKKAKAKTSIRKFRVKRGEKKIAGSKKKIALRDAEKKRLKQKSAHYGEASKKKGILGFTTYTDPKTGKRRIATKRSLAKRSEKYGAKAGKMGAMKKRQQAVLARREEKMQRRQQKLSMTKESVAHELVPLEVESHLDHQVMLHHALHARSNEIISSFHPEDDSWLTIAHHDARAPIEAQLLTPGGRAKIQAGLERLNEEERERLAFTARTLARLTHSESRVEELENLADELWDNQ